MTRHRPDSDLASRRPPTVAALVVAALALPGVGRPAPLAAHDEAVLESPATTVAVGGELRLRGRNFAAGEEHRLRLAGALESHDLRRVSPDTAGRVRISVRIPDEASPGRYRVEAVAPDGDVVARLPVTVVPGSPGEGATDPGGDGEPAREATAEEMEIERSRSGAEWAAIALLVVASGGLGAGLVRRS